MEAYYYWVSLWVLITPALVLVALRCLCKVKNSKGKGCVPEPPGAWPILGHLRLLKTSKTQRFRIISKLSEDYGPVFALRLGLKQVVFVNDWETAKECFTRNDKALAARPPSTAVGKYICHNDAYFGIASGEYWREMRKITMTHALSPTKLDQMKQLQVSEIHHFMKELHHHTSGEVATAVVVEISSWFARFSVNMITTLLARKRFPCSPSGGDDDSEKVHTAINDLLYAFGLPVMSDAVPWRIVEWWDHQSHISMMKRIAGKLDAVVAAWISEHRQRSMPHHSRGESDFIDVLLGQVGQGKLKFDKHEDDVVVISTIESIIAGGVDTTSATLTWLVTLLLNHEDAMKHAKKEIEQVVGRERWADESDMNKLIYLNAVIKETMRLYPAGPLGPPHMTIEECTIGGYRVAKGTKLFCNIWKLQRDPRVWEDPDEFRPERFISGSSSTDYMYMPFGVGRRICPGKDLVMRVLPLLLARLLQGFDLSLKLSQKCVDVNEGFGAILHKATPLEVVITPRLCPEMYAIHNRVDVNEAC